MMFDVHITCTRDGADCDTLIASSVTLSALRDVCYMLNERALSVVINTHKNSEEAIT